MTVGAPVQELRRGEVRQGVPEVVIRLDVVEPDCPGERPAAGQAVGGVGPGAVPGPRREQLAGRPDPAEDAAERRPRRRVKEGLAVEPVEEGLGVGGGVRRRESLGDDPAPQAEEREDGRVHRGEVDVSDRERDVSDPALRPTAEVRGHRVAELLGRDVRAPGGRRDPGRPEVGLADRGRREGLLRGELNRVPTPLGDERLVELPRDPDVLAVVVDVLRGD